MESAHRNSSAEQVACQGTSCSIVIQFAARIVFVILKRYSTSWLPFFLQWYTEKGAQLSRDVWRQAAFSWF